jgi:hypothetical protein
MMAGARQFQPRINVRSGAMTDGCGGRIASTATAMSVRPLSVDGVVVAGDEDQPVAEANGGRHGRVELRLPAAGWRPIAVEVS